MPKFKMVVEELLSHEVVVEAENEDEAYALASEYVGASSIGLPENVLSTHTYTCDYQTTALDEVTE